MNSYDKKYLDLLQDVLENGSKKNDRTGVGTYSVFGRMMRFDMSEGFPLLTTKKIFTKAMFHELLWFLQGGDNIKYLVDNGVRIWNEWPYERYIKYERAEVEKLRATGTLVDYQQTTMDEFVEKIKTDEEFAAEWGKLGPVYGYQWRKWEVRDENGDLYHTDQIQNVIDDLRNNPDSRRIMVSAWNPGQLKDMLLPPCHYSFQLWTKELTADEREKIYHDSGKPIKLVAHIKNESADVQEDKIANQHIHEFLDKEGVPRRSLSLMFHMRSVDLGLGFCFDVGLYATLLKVIAQCVKMNPHELLITMGDAHIYLNHVEQLKMQMLRSPYKLPKLWINPSINDISNFKFEDFKIIDYKCHDSIKMQVAV